MKPNKFYPESPPTGSGRHQVNRGGLLVFASVIAILLLIAKVTIPLFPPGRPMSSSVSAAAGTNQYYGYDEYQEAAYTRQTWDITSYDLVGGLISDVMVEREERRFEIRHAVYNNQYTMLGR